MMDSHIAYHISVLGSYFEVGNQLNDSQYEYRSEN